MQIVCMRMYAFELALISCATIMTDRCMPTLLCEMLEHGARTSTLVCRHKAAAASSYISLPSCSHSGLVTREALLRRLHIPHSACTSRGQGRAGRTYRYNCFLCWRSDSCSHQPMHASCNGDWLKSSCSNFKCAEQSIGC